MQPESADPEVSYLKEYVLVFLVSLPNILCGFVTGYATMTLPQMDLTLSDASWFSISNAFSAPFGSVILETLTDRAGRKSSLLIGISAHILGWSLLSLNLDTPSVFIGRILIGFFRNSMAFPAHIYAAECLTIKNTFQRNSLSTWTGITDAVGMFLVTLLSYFFCYENICAGIAILSMVLFIIIAGLLPESPVWLKKKGCIEKELGSGQPNVNEKCDSTVDQPKKSNWLTKNFEKLKRKDVYKPTIIITVADIILVMCGSTAVANYQVFIIGSHPHKIDPNSEKYYTYMRSLFSAVLQLFAHVLSTILMLRISAKLVVMSSCVLAAVSLTLMGCVMSEAIPSSLIWESVAVYLNKFAHNLFIYLTPLAIMGGTFPDDALGFSSVPVVAVGLTSGMLVLVHPYLVENVGNTLYYIYAGVSLLAGLFILIFYNEISSEKAKNQRKRFCV